MSVTNTSVRIAYTGDGSTTVFSFPFNLLTDLNAGVVISPLDVEVWFGSGDSAVQQTQGFTVNGPYANPNPNSVIFTSAPASGTVITIIRDKSLTQSSRFLNNQPFPASSFELALDRLTMEIQQLQEQLNRVPMADLVTAAATPMALPEPEAGLLLAWDSTGKFLVNASLPVFPPSSFLFGTQPPTVGTWIQGTIIFNSAPVASGVIGWVCTGSGTPGTWKAFGPITN